MGNTMGKTFLLAVAGVVALGVGATVIVYLGTIPPRRPAASAAFTPPIQTPVLPEPVALPPPPAQPVALPPSPPPAAAPITAAPVNAPEQLQPPQSNDPGDQAADEEDRRDHRRSRPRRR